MVRSRVQGLQVVDDLLVAGLCSGGKVALDVWTSAVSGKTGDKNSAGAAQAAPLTVNHVHVVCAGEDRDVRERVSFALRRRERWLVSASRRRRLRLCGASTRRSMMAAARQRVDEHLLEAVLRPALRVQPQV